MAQLMVHWVGGPTDGYIELMTGDRRPYMVSLRDDTDGYYVLEYDVAGQNLGSLTLTKDDVIARWHQRSGPHDFTTGDVVIVKASGDKASALAETTYVTKAKLVS